MDTQHVGMNMSFMMILLLGGIAIAVLIGLTQILGTLTGRQSHTHAGQVSHSRRSQGTALAAAIGVGALLLVGLLVGYRSGPVEVATTVAQHTGHSKPIPQLESSEGHEGGTVEAESPEAASVPAWTQTEKVVLHEGEVGETLFVASSQPSDSKELALREAVQLATVNLKERLSETYPDFSDRPIPEAVFKVHAIKQNFTESWMEQFGAFEEPMFRVYIQYEDSARVREPIVEAWQRSAVAGRVTGMAGGMGLAAMCLGMLSAFMRIFLAAPGKRRGPVITTTAFAGAAGLIATLV